MTLLRRALAMALLCFAAASVSAGLFDDEEARKAILDLRQRVEAVRQQATQAAQAAEQGASRASEENAALRRSLLELQNQIETLRADTAKLRGMNEQLARDLSEMQRVQKDVVQGVDSRLRQFEPVKVSLDGREFTAEPAEKRDFEAALLVFRKSEFAAAQPLFIEFLKRYPQTGYGASALFWLGNSQYATSAYKEAIDAYRRLSQVAPDHARVPEARLAIANCQTELKDTKSARKTLEDLVKSHPQSEAAATARDRLSRMR